MKKQKRLVKNFIELVWVEIKTGVYLRKEAIESINEEYLSVRTVSGMTYTIENKKLFLQFIKKIGFND